MSTEIQNAPTEPPAEVPAPPKTVPSTHPQGVETRRIEPVEIGRRTRPWSIRIDRLPGPFKNSGGIAHLGEPGVVRGSPEHTRQEIRRLEKLARGQEEAQRRAAAEAKRFSAEVRAAEERAQAELLAEIAALAKSVGGKATPTLCPRCVDGPLFVRQVTVGRAGSLDYSGTVAVKADFYLRALPDGSLVCGRCGRRSVAY